MQRIYSNCRMAFAIDNCTELNRWNCDFCLPGKKQMIRNKKTEVSFGFFLINLSMTSLSTLECDRPLPPHCNRYNRYSFGRPYLKNNPG